MKTMFEMPGVEGIQSNITHMMRIILIIVKSND